MKTIYVETLPSCDICNNGTKAAYDSKTIMGPFGKLCVDHMASVGIPSISTKLELKVLTVKRVKPKVLNKIPVVLLPLSMDSLVTVGCPACGYGRDLELDAHGIIKCESCNQDYKVIPAI